MADRTITARIVMNVTIVCSRVAKDPDGKPMTAEDIVAYALDGGTFDDSYGLGEDPDDKETDQGWLCCGTPDMVECEVTTDEET